MRRCFSVLFIFALAHFATAKGDIESNLIRVGVDAEHAVIDVTYWPDADNTQTRIIATGVQGSAFLINSDEYFITAAHVLEHYQPNSAHLTVSMKQRDGNGIGARFDVVEKDVAHDLALCKIKDFTAKKSDLDKPTGHPNYRARRVIRNNSAGAVYRY